MDTDRVDGLAGVALDELIARLEADAAVVAAAVSGAPSTGAEQEEWVARAAACQRVLNSVTGVQNAVIVRSASHSGSERITAARSARHIANAPGAAGADDHRDVAVALQCIAEDSRRLDLAVTTRRVGHIAVGDLERPATPR